MFLLAQGLPYQSYFFLGAVLVVVVLMLLRSQRSLSRRSSQAPSLAPAPRKEASRPPLHSGAQATAANWEVQMHEVARELSAQLDSKMGLLEQLIREADRAASRLETALAANGREAPSAASTRGAAPVAAGRDPPAVLSPVASLPCVESSPAAPPSPSSLPANQAEGLKGAGRPEVPPVPRLEDPAARGPAKDRRYEEIYTLADYGYPPAEIAQRVGTPVGEVQLILGLRKQRGA